MIPFIVTGLVEQFRCSECEWAIILEEPVFILTLHSELKELIGSSGLGPASSGTKTSFPTGSLGSLFVAKNTKSLPSGESPNPGWAESLRT